MIAALANVAWLAASLPAWWRFRGALRNPAAAQQRCLRSLLKNNADSEFGRAHGFGDIGSYELFCERVPLRDYDDLAPWIERIRRGEQGVLTQEPVTRLLPTSGSSGGRKLIPFTVGFQRELNAALGPWIADLFLTHPGVMCGPAYWSISPAIPVAEEESAVPIGFDDDSAYLGGWRGRLARGALVSTPTTSRNLRLVSVWHPSFFSLALEAFDDDPRAVWPRLRVVSCWGDGQAGLALEELRARLPHCIFQPKGLLATEGVVSIPFAGQHPVAVTSHFYEFEESGGTLRMAHELRPGERYKVIVTTGGGLWRYRLGDIVEVDGFVEATPSLRFLGRGGSVSDLCGEKLDEIFVTGCLEVACAGAKFAMLAPERDAGRWRYTLFIEGAPPDLARLERELRANPHYALCRDLGQLVPLQAAHVIGGYEKFCAGRKLGDVKPCALSQRTDWRQAFGLPPA